MEEDERSACSYPSLDLSFDHVKSVPYWQTKLAEAYNSQLVTLLSAATVVLGLGVSLVLGLGVSSGTDLDGVFEPWTGSFVALLVSALAYVLVAISAAFGLWSRDYHVMDNPLVIREDFWGLPPWQFKEQLLVHTEDAYELNERALKWKIRPIRAVLVLLPVETLSLVLALLLGVCGR